MRKVKRLFSLGPRMMLLLGEALFYLGWARILAAMPFAKVAPTLGTYMQETADARIDKHIEIIRHLSSAIHIMSKYTLWDSKCLVRAIAGMKMLQRRKIESTLYLGTAKDESSKMIAHAWLRSGSYYVTGKEGMEKFTVVGKFAKRMGGNE